MEENYFEINNKFVKYSHNSLAKSDKIWYNMDALNQGCGFSFSSNALTVLRYLRENQPVLRPLSGFAFY